MSIGRAGISSRLHRRRPACRSGRLPSRTGPHPPQAGGRRQLAPHDARALTEDPNPPANPACEPYPLTGENSAEPAPPIDIAHRSAQTPVLRSEEHTSELQSLMRISYAVFCLKKKHK